MGAGTAGYIIVKDGDKGRRASFRDFYGPLDKGAAKPSFCYPMRKEALKEDIKKMEKALENGYIAPERKMEAQINLKTKKERLDKLNDQESAARKLFEENKDKWMERRTALAGEISESMPSRESVRKRIVNPHSVLKKEKGGLEDKKKEFIILSRLAEEESNVSFLQKDK
jgi:hypothetical protein